MKIDPNDSRPAYRQAADDLRKRIEAGEWSPGTKLPSIRELAAEYEIAPQTVQNVLRELRQEKLVSAQQGRGFYIRDPGRPEAEESKPDADRLAEVEGGLRRAQEKIAALEEDNADLRARIMDLYGRIGETYPRKAPKGTAGREQTG